MRGVALLRRVNYSCIVSSVILGIAFVLGCYILNGEGSHDAVMDSPSNKIVESNKPLMTIQQTAQYLNLSESQVQAIISTEEAKLQTTGSFNGMMFPVLRIGKDILVSTDALNEWIKEATRQRKQY